MVATATATVTGSFMSSEGIVPTIPWKITSHKFS